MNTTRPAPSALRQTRRSGLVRLAAGVAFVATASMAAAGSATAASAHDDTTQNLPLTAMSASQLAAEACVLPGVQDDSVLRTLKSVADAHKVSSKVRLALFETAWVESHANSLPCGHSDSQGVFQQRPSQGWGSSSQVQDPTYAVSRFLYGIKGRSGAVSVAAAHPSWSAGTIAQAVQGSKYGYRYDQQAAKANALISRSNGIASGAVAAGRYQLPVVQYGERNNRVWAIQYLLKARGINVALDGSFGPGAVSAVRTFQSHSGLSADGYVGPNTWAKLILPLSPGAKSNAVIALQRELRVHGYNVATDGSYGPGTTAAVQTFRKGHHLPAASTVDASVWNTLVSIKR